MQQKITKDWRDTIKEFDPEMDEKLFNYIGHILARESEIPRKYKELILVATSSAMRNVNSLESHAQGALNHGATKKEIYEAISLASLSAGVPAFIEGLKVLEKL
ncbi:carboxymuconolactone decarboxylase family protein [Neobacillus vireti]|uniref:carboxymuconolactone decarboxylase family protein n=1 Tax=Neobacillus vireti TaxID=220686 RepID=UPI002FFE6BD3